MKKMNALLTPKKALANRTEQAVMELLPVDEKTLRRAARLLEPDCVGGEQVGYLEAPSDERAAARLQMMGGEFCGNATMALGALLCRREALADGELLCSSLLGNELKLVLHLGKEVFLGFELVAGFFNEFFRSALDILWITEAGLESVDFVAELEDVLFEVGLVLAMDVGRNLQIDGVAWDSEAEAGNLSGGNLWHAWSLG